jgi:hypothetical protein
MDAAGLRRQLAAANERYRKLAAVVMDCEPGEEPPDDEQCVLDIAAEGVHYTRIVTERVEREDAAQAKERNRDQT